MRIGDATLVNQPFLVIPYPYAFYERGDRVPLAGILGLEWFERFATRIDYVGRALTLTRLADFRYSGSGNAVPIRFQEDMPLAPAAADGHAGSFGVDTGNAGTLILFGDFLRRTGLLAKHPGGAAARGTGTGGGNTGRVVQLAQFSVGGHDLAQIATYLTQMRSGAFSSWTEAGNMGLTVLSRFTPTFDYAHQMLYLDRVAHPLALPPNRAGFFANKTGPAGFDVFMVKPKSSAAEAGIVPGDRIVRVDGKAAHGVSQADLYDLTTAPAGTRLDLSVEHASAVRTVRLTLR